MADMGDQGVDQIDSERQRRQCRDHGVAANRPAVGRTDHHGRDAVRKNRFPSPTLCRTWYLVATTRAIPTRNRRPRSRDGIARHLPTATPERKCCQTKLPLRQGTPQVSPDARCVDRQKDGSGCHICQDDGFFPNMGRPAVHRVNDGAHQKA